MLALVPGSALSAEYDGPFEVCDKIGENDHVICTPNGRCKLHVCYITMLAPLLTCTRTEWSVCSHRSFKSTRGGEYR